MKPVLWLMTTAAICTAPLAYAQNAAFNQTPPTYAAATRSTTVFDQAPPRTIPGNQLSATPASTAVMPNGPAPQAFEMPTNGKCQSVRSGDLVHFTLRIDSVQDARGVFTDLQLANGKEKYHPNDLPLIGGNVMGGGGVAMHDPSDPNLYRFAFIVPDVAPGIYRTLGIAVSADYGAAPGSPVQPVGIPLNRHAASEVRHYCLAVFGNGRTGHAPIVTEFKPGPIDRATR